MMILGLITQELHEQLLDPKNYQNRTNGVEELKHIISELNLTSVPPGSIVEFIHFLCSLLDDSNFKVLYGTLQVIRLLIQKLAFSLDKYFKRIVLVAVKALGDTRTVSRTEYMKVFRELMEHVVPQKVLNIVVGRLSHKNSRVREDVLNIITAAMLTHPRSDFDIPMLCLEVAPCLADRKRKVRHAALELFAVFDHCLDIGKKQPLTKAVDMVELNEDIEGLMAAVLARQARHILPRLSSEGLTEYALVVPKPGQHCSPQLGADLEWVLHGGRMNSARSYRNKQDSDRLFGNLGSLTDDLPLQRKISSAGKGKNKLPWEMSSLCSLPKGKSSEKEGQDSPSRGSPTFTSPASDSGLSIFHPRLSLMVVNSPGNSGPSKPHAARVPSAKLRSSMSMDISCLSQRDKTSPEVGVMGQRVTYSNRPMDCEDSNRTIEASPPLVRPEDLQLNDNALTSAGSLAKETPVSPTSPLGFQSALKCFDPPYQPSPPTVPPNNPKTSARLRKTAGLNRTRPSLSHCSDELSQGTLGQKQDLTESPECTGPFSEPELVMAQSFSLISSDNWEMKIKGLMFLRRLAQHHLDTIQTRLHDVCLVLIQEVKSLASTVSRVAVGTLGELYSRMECKMDQELEATVRALLQKAVERNGFIRQEVDAALAAMVQHCTPARCIHALLAGELSNLNSAVRACAGQHLADVLEEVGVIRLLSGRKDATDRIIQAVVKLAQDSAQEARIFGRRMLLFLSSHRDFEKMLEKCIPKKDLPIVQNIVRTLKTKGLGETAQDPPSARGRRALPGSGTITALTLTRKESNSQHGSKPSVHRITDKTEYIKQLCTLLNSKDFRERIKGIDQLVADCQTNPSMVVKSLFPVFDAFKERLLESNRKLNLYALESLKKIVCLLKGDMSQVVNILLPAITDNHLNSNNIPIYCAATEVLGELMLNLDNILLLEPFCAKARFLSGKAKVDLIGKVAELVTELYPRKPKLVEQKALSLLWYLLGTSSHSRTVSARYGSVNWATANLCYAFHALMGPGLAKSAVSQLPNVQKALNDLLLLK
ncbi:hypothetical protein NHX12_020125 [Muraenolepis orangiensis]|uniref:TOG domain-containing protein n=1 Tax=Muraenolepis orangiensis TaxID=630683 RepID=A0A9Q0EUU6_9TELE|nr:hypothetical protein NHX12_020125 [Muraenolepis orangiensis]